MHYFFQTHRSKSIKLTRLYINRSPTPVNKLSQMSAFQVARLTTSREIFVRSVLCQQRSSTISLRKVSSPRPLHSAPKPSRSRSVI